MSKSILAIAATIALSIAIIEIDARLNLDGPAAGLLRCAAIAGPGAAIGLLLRRGRQGAGRGRRQQPGA